MRQRCRGHKMALALRELVTSHPCYCPDAARRYGRVHLPVAPACNIQCYYCDRRYDCPNESRPGVTSQLFTPEEALLHVRRALDHCPEITVAGIAGPGDPLATPERTLRTLALIQRTFPQLHLCLSTNGLALPEYVNDLQSLHVNYVTITINSVDPAIGAQLYAWVCYRDQVYRGLEAAALLWRQQRAGLEALVKHGVLVKVNSVLIPGVNHEHIAAVAREVAELGAFILNVLPLIPVPGTSFASYRAPSLEERHRVVQACSPFIRVMRHCQQCRADAMGLLGHDRQGELFSGKDGSDDLRSSLLHGERQGPAT